MGVLKQGRLWITRSLLGDHEGKTLAVADHRLDQLADPNCSAKDRQRLTMLLHARLPRIAAIGYLSESPEYQAWARDLAKEIERLEHIPTPST